MWLTFIPLIMLITSTLNLLSMYDSFCFGISVINFYASLNVDKFNIEFIEHVRLLLLPSMWASSSSVKIPYLINFMKMPYPSSPAFFLAGTGTCTSDSPFKWFSTLSWEYWWLRTRGQGKFLFIVVGVSDMVADWILISFGHFNEVLRTQRLKQHRFVAIQLCCVDEHSQALIELVPFETCRKHFVSWFF